MLQVWGCGWRGDAVPHLDTDQHEGQAVRVLHQPGTADEGYAGRVPACFRHGEMLHISSYSWNKPTTMNILDVL